MGVIVDVRIPAVPVAQPRARATIRGSHAAVYTPSKHPVTAFKATVRQAVSAAYDGPPLDGALKVSAAFIFPRTKQQIWKRKPMPRLRHTKKPDRDNCDKAICDALTGLLWIDDCQVCAGSLNKWIAAGDEQPHVRLIVETIE